MFRTVFVAVALAAAPAAAVASVVPDSQLIGAEVWNGNIGAQYPTTAGSYAEGPATLVIVTDRSPSLLAVARLASGSGRAIVGAEFKYFFVLSGPGTDLVPLAARISGAVRVVNSIGVQASGGATIGIGAASNVNVALGTSPGFDYDQSYSGTQSFFARPGDVNVVDLQASANLDGDSSHFGGYVSAYADPYITIDPDFAAAHPGYSLSFSDGVGNTLAGAVPEPAGWALLLTGFGIIGAALRRRSAMQGVAA